MDYILCFLCLLVRFLFVKLHMLDKRHGIEYAIIQYLNWIENEICISFWVSKICYRSIFFCFLTNIFSIIYSLLSRMIVSFFFWYICNNLIRHITFHLEKFLYYSFLQFYFFKLFSWYSFYIGTQDPRWLSFHAIWQFKLIDFGWSPTGMEVALMLKYNSLI
jgi:hypothetical protein